MATVQGPTLDVEDPDMSNVHREITPWSLEYGDQA